MTKLIANTVVRRGFDVVVLLAGEEVPEWASEQVGEHLVEQVGKHLVEQASTYAGLVKADLQAEIDRRNTDRVEGNKITPASDKIADLINALEADDAAAAAASE